MAGSTPSNRGRFNLQFNLDDDVQNYAYEILKTQGHQKSAFISAAIKFYIERADWDPPARAAITNFHSFQVKEIIKAAIEEIGPEELASILTSASGNSPVRRKSSFTEEISQITEEKNVFEEKSQAIAVSSPSAKNETTVQNEPVSDDNDDEAADALFDALSLFG